MLGGGGGGGGRSQTEETPETEKQSKWGRFKEKTEMKAAVLQVKAAKAANELMKEVSAESSEQRKLIEGMHDAGDISESEMQQMLSTMERQEEIEKEELIISASGSSQLTLKEKLKQKAAEEFMRRKAKADQATQEKLVSDSRFEVPDAFWVRINNLHIVSDERCKELAYDSTELFGSVAGYNQLYSGKVSHEFSNAMVYTRRQINKMIHKLLAQYANNSVSILSARVSAAAAGVFVDWRSLIKYFDEILNTPGELLYQQVFTRMLSQMFETFCRTLELILTGEIKIPNFESPGPCVEALSGGLQLIAEYFHQGGDGLSSRVIDNRTDEDSRLTVIFELHRKPTETLIKNREKVDEYMYNQEQGSLQPILDTLWRNQELPVPGVLDFCGEAEYSAGDASESRRDFARFFLANAGDILLCYASDQEQPTLKPIENTSIPYSGSVNDDVTNQALAGFQVLVREALSVVLIMLETEDLEKLCLRIIEHMTVSPGMKVATDFDVPPSLLQPKFVLLVDESDVRVVTSCFIGGPIRGDRPDRKCTPYVLTVVTENLLASEEEAVAEPEEEADPTQDDDDNESGSGAVREGWMRVEEGHKKKAIWARRWFRLMPGGTVLVYTDDSDSAENLFEFKCSSCKISLPKSKRKAAPCAFRINTLEQKLIVEPEPATAGQRDIWMRILKDPPPDPSVTSRDGEAGGRGGRRGGLVDISQFAKKTTVTREAVKELMLKHVPKGETIDFKVIEQSFLEFDTDGDGAISLVELRNGLRKLNATLTHKEIEDICTYMDRDGNREVDFKEFAEILGTAADTSNRTILQYAVRGTCKDSMVDILQDDVSMLATLTSTDLDSALVEAMTSSSTYSGEDSLLEGIELRIPEESSRFDQSQAEESVWSMAEDESSSTFLSLRVLTTRQNDASANAYCSSLTMRVPSSLGLPRNEKLLERVPVTSQQRAGQLLLTSSFLCFEERESLQTYDDDSSDEEDNEFESEQVVIMLKHIRFLKRDTSTTLEVGTVEGAVHLFEGFSKKDTRDNLCSAAIQAASAFGVQLGESDGFSSDWIALQAMFSLPTEEPLIEDYRCNCAMEDKSEGRLYITPFFACFTEGRGRDRTIEAFSFVDVETIDRSGAGIVLKTKSGRSTKLYNFRAGARDKVLILLQQLHSSTQQQVADGGAAKIPKLGGGNTATGAGASGSPAEEDTDLLQGWLNMERQAAFGLTDKTK